MLILLNIYRCFLERHRDVRNETRLKYCSDRLDRLDRLDIRRLEFIKVIALSF